MAEDRDQDNICCPELVIAPCADTEEHCHLICAYSGAILTNDAIKNKCIGDFIKCILQGEIVGDNGR